MQKNSLRSFNVVVNQSMTTSITSAPTNIQFLDNITYQYVWTGAPVGTFSIQTSSNYTQDQQGNVTNAGNWDTVPIGSTPNPVTGGAAGDGVVELQQMSAPFIRTVYTATSGTGTLNVFVSAKSLG